MVSHITVYRCTLFNYSILQENTSVLASQETLLVEMIESHFLEYLQREKSWGDHIIQWDELAAILNDMGPPFKSGTEWSECFEKMKQQTHRKVAMLRHHQNKTGGGSSSGIELSGIEDKILMIYGKDHFDKIQGVGECGMERGQFERISCLDSISAAPLAHRKEASSKSTLTPKQMHLKYKLF